MDFTSRLLDQLLRDFPVLMKKHLKMVVRFSKKTGHARRRKGFKFSCFEEFVLKHGIQGKITKDSFKIQKEVSQCFSNAYLLAEEQDLIYVEGYATIPLMPILPFLHAWCFDKTGNVLDPTWEKGVEYLGVPFDLNYVRSVLFQKETSGVIDNMEMGFPLLTGEHTDFLTSQIKISC